jgi:hypothetical protein
MPRWQQHVKCTQIIRAHRDWSDEQVLEAAHMHKLEIDIVQAARREVEGEALPGDMSSQRSY